MAPDTPALSRRSVLRGGLTAGAVVGTGVTLPSVVRAVTSADSTPADDADATELRVATWNLGLGANLFSLFSVEDRADLARTVGDLYESIGRSAVEARMGAVADELARTRPDVVGVQEAALVRTGPPTESEATDERDAETVAFDFLSALTDALDERETPYDVAQVTTNADAEFPGRVDGRRVDVRLTDRDAILVRSDADVSVTERSAATFAEALVFPTGESRTLRVDRGYGVVSATIDGGRVTVVNTHLESASERVRGAQADELASVLDGLGGSVVLLGDLNDGPAFGGGAYETLSSNLTDAWDAARPDADGDTCCRAATLDGPGALDERVDHVLVGSGLAATDAQLVGVSEASRVRTTVDGASRTLWPSDHAGVGATLRATATAEGSADAADTTPVPTAENGTGTGDDATGTETSPAEPTTDAANRTARQSNGTADATTGDGGRTGDSETATESPGFGPLAGVVGVVGAAAGLLRRRRDGAE
ncbi:endonuclease/exonuclease/phosphatase family protein [Halogeometricum limi]|uniref:PGF-CTERM protein n=1 Tax=Halogeometricum limi TaxID=555875 RepID=A0A1I6G1U3_9EURY|nr:endonuclease/exonuclease/phosphatase family protein [Halogeometricum limi]SFR36110.1 PGF-CTERM protein [Halogeometricum limi]